MTELRTHIFQFLEAAMNAQRATTPDAQEFAVALAADAFRACFMDLVQEGLEKAKRVQPVPVTERTDASK